MSIFRSRIAACSPLAVCASVFAIFSFAACADDDSFEARGVLASVAGEPGAIDGGGEQAAAASVQADSGRSSGFAQGVGRTVRDPQGAYFADVTAIGTGCPAGTWSTNLSPDGQSFITTFSAFEVEVDSTRSIAVADCMLVLRLHAPQGLSYTVEDVFFGGYVYLEPGVQAKLQSKVYFAGLPDDGSEMVSEFGGPQDESFLVPGTGKSVIPVRSPCGTEQTLNVRLTLLLRNSNPRGNGYIGVQRFPPAEPRIKLSWRRCTE